MHRAHGRRLLAALALSAVVLVLAATTAWSWTSEYGHVGAPDRVLRSGCHDYRYHYVVTTPTRDWTLETFLRDPDR